MKHEEYVKIIKSSASKIALKVLTQEISKKLPFLFLPVLGPITTLALEKIVSILLEQTEFAIFFKYIDLRVDAQGRSFSEAAIRNYHIQQTGTPEEKANAEKELIEKFRAFVILSN